MSKTKQNLKPIDKPNYSYWQALYMAFYSSRLYVDVIKRWAGYGFIYSLLLMVLLSIPWSIWYTSQFNHYLMDKLIFPINQMPTLLIQNGQLSFDKPMPYVVNDKQGKPAIFIDTEGKMDAFPKAYPTLSILIMKDKLLFRQPIERFLPGVPLPLSNEKPTIYEFNQNDNEIFTGKEWIETSGIKKLKHYALVIIYPIVLGAFFGLYFVFNIVLSSVGRIIAIVILKYKITFKQSFRLTWVASTAPLATLTLLQFLGMNMNGTGLYYMGCVAAYFSFAVIAVKRENKRMVSN